MSEKERTTQIKFHKTKKPTKIKEKYEINFANLNNSHHLNSFCGLMLAGPPTTSTICPLKKTLRCTTHPVLYLTDYTGGRFLLRVARHHLKVLLEIFLISLLS